MNKLLFFIFFTVLTNFLYSQKVTLSLSDRKIIYTEISNPIDFGIEGYLNKEIYITTNGCSIDSQYKYLKATTPGDCKVIFHYLKKGVLDSQIIGLKIKKLPRMEVLYGDLESGEYTIERLMVWDSLRVEIPFDTELQENLNFKILTFSCAFVPVNGNACFYNITGNKIPQSLKDCIFSSHSGDKILIDDIKGAFAYDKNKLKRMSPIVVTVRTNSKPVIENSHFYLYQPSPDSSFRQFTKELKNCDNSFSLDSGILQCYQIKCSDTLLSETLALKNGIVVWKKTYWNNGNVSTYISFNENENIGNLISYHKNGTLKTEGKIIRPLPNLFQSYRGEMNFGGHVSREHILVSDSFLLFDFAPYGKWVGYHDNGKIALECELNLFEINETIDEHYYTRLDMFPKKQVAIKEILVNKEKRFISRLSGKFTTYNRNGDLDYQITY